VIVARQDRYDFPMPNKQPQMLEALKLELHFLENGGYEPSVHCEPRKQATLFLDSPLCLNVLPVKGAYPAECGLFPCSKCWLIGFVPAARRYAPIPCHHIPLNQRGDTIASMGPSMKKSGGDLTVHDTVRNWLYAKRQELEATPVQPQVPPQAAGAMSQSQSA
jgi:hypothetical protein